MSGLIILVVETSCMKNTAKSYFQKMFLKITMNINIMEIFPIVLGRDNGPLGIKTNNTKCCLLTMLTQCCKRLN
jgi:hypothetical protein